MFSASSLRKSESHPTTGFKKTITVNPMSNPVASVWNEMKNDCKAKMIQ